MGLLSLFGGGAIGQWRDAHLRLARSVMEQAAADLIETLDSTLAEADWRDGLIDQSRFIATRIAPMVRNVAEPLARRVLEEAEHRLGEIAPHPVPIRWRPRPPEGDGWQDMVAEVQDWAVAGGTALFGMVRAAATALPAAPGGAFAARDWMRLRAEQRLRARVHGYVVAVVLKGPKGRPAILEMLAQILADAAREARRL